MNLSTTYMQLVTITEVWEVDITQLIAKMVENGTNSTIVLVMPFQRKESEAQELTSCSTSATIDYESFELFITYSLILLIACLVKINYFEIINKFL